MRNYFYTALSAFVFSMLVLALVSCGYREQINVTGLPGANGLNGADGAPGANGQDGAQGPQGEMGPRGETGAQGPAGADGLDGSDGSVAQIISYPASNCTLIAGTSSYTKKSGSNYKLYTSSSCSSASSFGELSQGESMWVSASALAVWDSSVLRVIFFN